MMRWTPNSRAAKEHLILLALLLLQLLWLPVETSDPSPGSAATTRAPETSGPSSCSAATDIETW